MKARLAGFLGKVFLLERKERIAILIFSVAAVVAGSWYALVSPALELHATETAKSIQLREEIVTKRQQASNLDKVKSDYRFVQQRLSSAILELPNSREIPGLMVSITDAGRSQQVDFLTFKPGAEVKQEFYADVPVNISVRGSYHAIGGFFASVAQLPRIVGLSNLSISEIKQSGSGTLIKLNGVATTYRFLDSTEPKNVEKK